MFGTILVKHKPNSSSRIKKNPCPFSVKALARAHALFMRLNVPKNNTCVIITFIYFFPSRDGLLAWLRFETPSSAPADPPVRPPFRHGVYCQALFKPTELHFEFQSRSRSFQRHQTCQAELQLNVQAVIHMTCCIFHFRGHVHVSLPGFWYFTNLYGICRTDWMCLFQLCRENCRLFSVQSNSRPWQGSLALETRLVLPGVMIKFVLFGPGQLT